MKWCGWSSVVVGISDRGRLDELMFCKIGVGFELIDYWVLMWMWYV